MSGKLNNSFFNSIVQKMLKNKNVYGAILCVENGDASHSWTGAAGDINADDR